MKVDNTLRSAVKKIRMTDACKRRIIEACKADELPCREITKIPAKRYVAIALCSVLIVAFAITVLATAGFLRLPVYNKPHLPGENKNNDTDEFLAVNDVASKYNLICNGIAGDRDNVYFDLTVKREDGGIVASAENGGSIIRYDAFDSYLEFENGYKKEVYFSMLEDSNDYEYHFEGMSLFYNDEKQYLGQKANLFVGGIAVTLENGEQEVVCEFDDAVEVVIDVCETVRTVYFDKDEFSLYDGGIVVTSATFEGAKITLYCECRVSGLLYGLQDTVAKAYVISDGEKVALGGKTDAGTLPDGKFVIGWLLETVIDPEKVSALCVDGKTIVVD